MVSILSTVVEIIKLKQGWGLLKTLLTNCIRRVFIKLHVHIVIRFPLAKLKKKTSGLRNILQNLELIKAKKDSEKGITRHFRSKIAEHISDLK